MGPSHKKEKMMRRSKKIKSIPVVVDGEIKSLTVEQLIELTNKKVKNDED